MDVAGMKPLKNPTFKQIRDCVNGLE